MINFGDQLGNLLVCESDRIYTFSDEDLLFLDKETMKLSHRINLGAEIASIGVNGDIYILTKNSDFMVYSVDGKQIQHKHHKNKIFEHPIFHNDHFLCHDKNHILRVGLTCSTVYNISHLSNINCIQYSTFKEQIIIANDKEIHIIGNDDRVIRLSQTITNIKLDDENDLLACGLNNGALVIIQYSTGITIQSDHWHAHPINAILFSTGSLYTAGKEGVIVQWHLKVARKVFYPRQGGEIVALQSMGDILIANIKTINQIKQISLIGQNQLPSFNGIHHTYPTCFLNYQNKLLIPGELGTIQLINQGSLISTIPICQKNYISDIDEKHSRNLTKIDQFLTMDRFLIVLLKSTYKQTLQFFENTNNMEFTLLATTDYDIDGINVGFGCVITWGKGEIRVWKQVQQSKGQLVWNCIFRGNGYKGQNIITAKIIDEFSIKLVTNCSILTIKLQDNQILEEIALDQSNPDVAYIYDNGVIVCDDGLIQFYSDVKKQFKTQLGKFTSIQKLSDNLIAIYCDVALVIDLKQQKILHGVQSQKLITTYSNGRTLLYSYNHENNLYKFVIALTSERKASLMVEEQETANFEQKEQPEKPVIENAAPLDPNVYRRLQLAKQARQIKELNLKEYLQMPSHQLPSLMFLAERTQEVLRQDFSENKFEHTYSIEIDTEKGEQQQNNQKIDLAQLKKLFK